MLKNVLLGLAAAVAITGGAAVFQPSTAEAGVKVYIGSNHHGWSKHRRHRVCHTTYRRVRADNHHRHGWHWTWKPVRVCKWR